MSNPIIQILPLPDKKLLLAEETEITGISDRNINKYTPNGTYKITASSYGSNNTLPYMAFNGSDTNYWQCDYNGSPDELNKKYPKYISDSYNGKNPSTYQGGGAQPPSTNTWTTLVGSDNMTSTILGEWIQVKLPFSTYLYSYSLKTPVFTEKSTFPKRFTIVGSNDGSTWEYVDQQNVKTPVINSKPMRVYNINTTKPYSYFRLIISEMPDGMKNIMLNQWNLNGTLDITPNPNYKQNESFVTLSRCMDINKCNFLNEGFDDYGYTPSNYITYNNPNELKSEIINRQIIPMTKISKDYSKKLSDIDNNYKKLDKNINDITNNEQKGLRDIMMNNPIYDFSGNRLNIDKPIVTITDGRKEDIDIMINQTNSLYVLGTITAVTLLI